MPDSGIEMIFSDDRHLQRRAGIIGYMSYGMCVLDNRSPEERGKPVDRPYLSPADRKAKSEAEEYVRRRSHL